MSKSQDSKKNVKKKPQKTLLEKRAAKAEKAAREAEKRRRAEQRLEEARLREELGDYDLEFDDY